jgi:hypothetical protein
MDIRTHPVSLRPDPTLPTGVWDPLWEKPEVAARIASNTFLHLFYKGAKFDSDTLIADNKLPEFTKKNTEHRTFPLTQVLTLAQPSVQFRGGSYGEIYRRYTYGGPKPAVNFHAQQVSFGVDSEGRYFLSAVVGRVDGMWGNKVTLAARFVGTNGSFGALLWEGEVDPPKDYPVELFGKSERMANAFSQLKEVAISFYTKPS